MTQFRKKPEVIEATQWFVNGDHPQDDVFRPFEDTGKIPTEPREGAVVRYFRHPAVPRTQVCSKCGKTMHEHGWIDLPRSGYNVCPGDWVITSGKDTYYPCNPSIFRNTYERF